VARLETAAVEGPSLNLSSSSCPTGFECWIKCKRGCHQHRNYLPVNDSRAIFL